MQLYCQGICGAEVFEHINKCDNVLPKTTFADNPEYTTPSVKP